MRWRRLTSVLATLAVVAGHGLAQADETLRRSGDALELLLPATALSLALAREDRDGVRQLLTVAATTTVATYGLKAAVHDRGPDGDPHAFPSGHTSISVATAEFLRRRYGWNYGAPAYAAAALVGYSRIASDAHDLDDVIGGAAIGFASAALWARPLEGGQVTVSGGNQGVLLWLSRNW